MTDAQDPRLLSDWNLAEALLPLRQPNLGRIQDHIAAQAEIIAAKEAVFEQMFHQYRVAHAAFQDDREEIAEDAKANARAAAFEEAAKIADDWRGSNFDGCADSIYAAIRALAEQEKL